MRVSGYRAFIRQQPCFLKQHDPNHRCQGSHEAHHLRDHADAGYAQKPGDEHCICLCQGAHTEYHHVGHDAFLERHQLTDTEMWAWKLSRLAQYAEEAVILLHSR